MNLGTGIVLLILLSIFFFYGMVSIRHAARFKYLGQRTIYLTLIFVVGSTVLILLGTALYIGMIVN